MITALRLLNEMAKTSQSFNLFPRIVNIFTGVWQFSVLMCFVGCTIALCVVMLMIQIEIVKLISYTIPSSVPTIFYLNIFHLRQVIQLIQFYYGSQFYLDVRRLV